MTDDADIAVGFEPKVGHLASPSDEVLADRVGTCLHNRPVDAIRGPEGQHPEQERVAPRLVAVDRPCESKSKACCEEASADALWDGQTAVKMLRTTAETALVEFTLNDSTNDEDGKGGPIVHVAVFKEGFREFRLFRTSMAPGLLQPRRGSRSHRR